MIYIYIWFVYSSVNIWWWPIYVQTCCEWNIKIVCFCGGKPLNFTWNHHNHDATQKYIHFNLVQFLPRSCANTVLSTHLQVRALLPYISISAFCPAVMRACWRIWALTTSPMLSPAGCNPCLRSASQQRFLLAVPSLDTRSLPFIERIQFTSTSLQVFVFTYGRLRGSKVSAWYLIHERLTKYINKLLWHIFASSIPI
jgi:hypothetical protein